MAVYAQLSNLLLSAGLSEAESRIYAELLKKPAETRWELVGRTGLDRNTVYRACDKLESLKMAAKEGNLYRALSLKALVADLNMQGRKCRKLSNQIKNIAPYLRIPNESVEEMDTLYTRDQIEEAFQFMAEHDYDTNLEFGDFENFIPVLGSIQPGIKFREKRIRHASSHAICTTFGPYSAYFGSKPSQELYKLHVDRLNIDFRGRFIQFSDNSDYVLFHNFSETGNEHSVLVKSKAVADVQRAQFGCFSQMVEKTV